jgi:hypothetical protein
VRAAAIAVLFLSAPALAADPLPREPAAPIDPSTFSHRRTITAPPSAEGVTRIPIDPSVVAVARRDLADLRVIDADARQWPYVLRTEAYREDAKLAIEVTTGERGRSHVRLTPPVAPAWVDGITLTIDRAFFDRPYRLLGDLPDGAERHHATLASGRLSRAVGAAGTIEIGFTGTRVDALDLWIDDGDEAPLPIASAVATQPLAEIRLVAPPGAYTLLVGDASAEPPRYEIAKLRDRVLAATAPTCALGPLGPSPDHQAPAPRHEERQQIALWAAMAIAVVGLGWITLRLSRKEESRGKDAET